METHYGNYHETTTATVSEYETVVSYFQKVVFVPFFFLSLGGMCQAVFSLGNVQGNNKNFLFFTVPKNSGKDVAFTPFFSDRTHPPHSLKSSNFNFPSLKNSRLRPHVFPRKKRQSLSSLKCPKYFCPSALI